MRVEYNRNASSKKSIKVDYPDKSKNISLWSLFPPNISQTLLSSNASGLVKVLIVSICSSN